MKAALQLLGCRALMVEDGRSEAQHPGELLRGTLLVPVHYFGVWMVCGGQVTLIKDEQVHLGQCDVFSHHDVLHDLWGHHKNMVVLDLTFPPAERKLP